MYKKKKTEYYLADIDKKLFMANEELYNLQNNWTIIRIMKDYGYDTQKTAAFANVLAEAREANLQKSNGCAHKVSANTEFKKLFARTKKKLSYLIRIARVLFEQDYETLSLLQLDRRQARTIIGQLDFMDHFYQQLLERHDLAGRLVPFGYPTEVLLSCRTEYQTIRTTFNNLSSNSAAAQEATRERNRKMAELNQWMREYYTFAKIAFELNPDWLELQQAEEARRRKAEV